jgi:protein ImuB
VDRWACVSLPALPLQIVSRSKPEWRALPTVVVSEDKPQGKVQWANAAALQAGVLPGQSYALSLSLCSGLHACVVQENVVDQVTEELKALLWRFSPALEVGEEAGVFWLDASGLGRLYTSLAQWSEVLREQLMKLGFRACVVVGFSRFGAMRWRAQVGSRLCLARAKKSGSVWSVCHSRAWTSSLSFVMC